MRGFLLLGEGLEDEFSEEGLHFIGVVGLGYFDELAYEVCFVVFALSLLGLCLVGLRDVRRVMESCPF